MGDCRVDGSRQVVLALSGGGGRGGFHLGALQALEEAGIEIKAISANSIGSIIACSYLSGRTPKDILTIISSKAFSKIIRFNFLRGSLFRIEKNSPILQELFPKKYIQNLPIPVFVNSTNFDTGELQAFHSGEILSCCLASSAAWPILSTQTINNESYMDGGYSNNLPIKEIKALGLPIIAINLHPLTKKKDTNFFQKLSRMIFISWQSQVIHEHKEYDLEISDTNIKKIPVLRFKQSEKAYDLGYTCAKKKIDAYLKSRV